MSLRIAAIAPPHLEGAGRVLAAVHAELRQREPALPERFERSDVAAEHVARLLNSPGARGFHIPDPAGADSHNAAPTRSKPAAPGLVALRGGEVVGYLIGAIVVPVPGTITRSSSSSSVHSWLSRASWSGRSSPCSGIPLTIGDADASDPARAGVPLTG